MPNKKTDTANNNDGISEKEKSRGSVRRISSSNSSVVEQSVVVESTIDSSGDCITASTSTVSIPVETLQIN